jgi:hypothetical protein
VVLLFAADQMVTDQVAVHVDNGGGGRPLVHHSRGPGGGTHMSEAEAREFFLEHFFGQDDDPSVDEGDWRTIPNGTIVSLKGLVSQPDRNGYRGKIIDYDESSGRYIVSVEASDEMLRVKPDNLLQHVQVNLVGTESQPALNGERGTIVGWDTERARYMVYVINLSKIFSLKPTNVILENGTVAKITGLKAKPELNDRFGTIQSWIRDSNRYDRYEVQLSDSQVVRIKVENVRV